MQIVETIPLDDIVLDADFQYPGRNSEELVEEYKRLHADYEKDLGPLVVFDIEGLEGLLLVDGWHRYHALRDAGAKEVPVVIMYGTRDDALAYLYAEANRHGRPLTDQQKRWAVEQFLDLPAARAMSLRDIAARLGVSKDLVRLVRGPSRPTEPGENTCLRKTSTDTEVRNDDPPFEPTGRIEPGRSAFDRDRELFDDLISDAADLKARILRLLKTPAGKWLSQGIETDVTAVVDSLKRSAPANPCLSCKGEGCGRCRGAGWLREKAEGVA